MVSFQAHSKRKTNNEMNSKNRFNTLRLDGISTKQISGQLPHLFAWTPAIAASRSGRSPTLNR